MSAQEFLVKMMELTKKAGGPHKSSEPSVSVAYMFDDGKRVKTVVELYSYTFELKDGGRHHTFEVPDGRSVGSVFEEIIELAEKEAEEEAEATDEMEAG